MNRDRNATLDQFLGGEAGDAGRTEAEGPESESGTETEEPGASGEMEEAEEPGAPGGESDSAPAPAPEADAAPGETEPAEAAPAEPTYRWTPDGTPCEDCGERVERLWRAAGERSGAFVCASCKDWERGR